jgi:hypothetical protein
MLANVPFLGCNVHVCEGSGHFEVAVGDVSVSVFAADQSLLQLGWEGFAPEHRWLVDGAEPDSSHSGA